MLNRIVQDLLYAARGLRRNPLLAQAAGGALATASLAGVKAQ